MLGVTDIAARAVRILSTLLGVHLEYAKREAQSDASRLVAGVIMLLGAMAFLGAAAFALSAAAVVALAQQTQLGWLGAILVVGAADLFLGALLGLAGKGRFKGPIMRETRGMVKKTFSSLKEA